MSNEYNEDKARELLAMAERNLREAHHMWEEAGRRLSASKALMGGALVLTGTASVGWCALLWMVSR